MVGISLVFLVLVELLFQSVTWLRPESNLAHGRTDADGYRNAPWVSSYWNEFTQATRNCDARIFGTQICEYNGEHIHVSVDGIRRTWSKDEGTGGSNRITIWMFGGSTMWGMGARDDFTLPSCVARQLDAAGYPVEVKNYGQLGYTTGQETAELLLQLQRQQPPNIVVFYDGVNDAFYAYDHGFAGASNITGTETRSVVQGIKTIALKSQFVRSICALRKPDSRSCQIPQDGWLNDGVLERQVVERYKQNLRTIEALAQIHGFQSRFYWQPVAFTKTNLTPYEQGQLEVAAERWGPELRPFYLSAYSILRSDEELSRMSTYRDLSRIFDDEDAPFYVDFNHLSEDGNKRIASEIVRDMKPILDRIRSSKGDLQLTSRDRGRANHLATNARRSQNELPSQ